MEVREPFQIPPAETFIMQQAITHFLFHSTSTLHPHTLPTPLQAQFCLVSKTWINRPLLCTCASSFYVLYIIVKTLFCGVWVKITTMAQLEKHKKGNKKKTQHKPHTSLPKCLFIVCFFYSKTNKSHWKNLVNMISSTQCTFWRICWKNLERVPKEQKS